jgi:PKD repeat protein
MKDSEVVEIRNRILYGDDIFAAIYSNAFKNRDGGNVRGIYQNAIRSTHNNRIDRAVLAKNKAFVALMGIRPEGDATILVEMSESEKNAIREEAIALLRNFDESAWSDHDRPSNFFEELAFIADHQDELYDLQYRSRELICYLEAYDMLRPIGGDRVWEEDIARRLMKFASNIYFLADFFGSAYAYNNHRIMSGSALGMAGILFGDWGADDANFGNRDARSYMPQAWVGYGMININTVLYSYQVFSDGGYNEGPHYLRYGFAYALPFYKAMKNFGEVYQLSDSGQPFGDWVEEYSTYPGSVYSLRSPWFGRVNDAQPDLEDILEWITKIRQPEGRVPGIADTFNDTYFPEISIFGGPYYWPLASYESHIGDLEILNWSLSSLFDNRVDFIAAGNLPQSSPPSWDNFQVFEQTGDIVFRSGWGLNDIYLHVYARNYAYGSYDFHRSPHHQDDNSSFLLSFNKQVLALDGGFISWNDKEKVADPTHHNLLLVTGEGPDRNSTTAQIEDTRNEDFYDYARIRTEYRGVSIRRGFVFLDNQYFVIKDRIDGQSLERYQLAFHGNDTNPLEESGSVIWQKEDALLKAFITTNGGRNNLDYVFSDQIHDNGYGLNRIENHRALSVGRTSTDMQYLSVLFPFSSEIENQPEIEDIIDNSFAGVFVDRTAESSLGNRYEIVVAQWPRTTTITLPQNQYGANNREIAEISTDADLLAMSFDAEDPDDPNKIKYFHVGMSTLKYGNYFLFPQIAPRINPIEDIIMNEMDTLQVFISASDSNGHYLSFSLSGEANPSFIKLINFGDGTAIIELSPGYLDSGSYADIEVTVHDSGTPQMSDQTTFNVLVQNVNVQPIANITSDIQNGSPPMTVNFSGQTSIDPDGTIESYRWNLGDGTVRVGQDISHTYDIAGKYHVILTVTDSERATHSDTLTIINNPDLNKLYISEASYADDINGEYIELYNNAPYAINLREYKLIQMTPEEDVIYIFDFGLEERWPESTTIIPPGQFLLIGRDVSKSDFAEYWDLSTEYLFYNSGVTELASGSSGRRWQLRYSDGTTNQNNGTLIEDTQEVIAGYLSRSFQRLEGIWTHTSYSSATPGYMDNDQSLAVNLTSFKAQSTKYSIVLNWETASEINNLGFYILRSSSKDCDYRQIASYQSDDNLKGQGNSPEKRQYKFEDIQLKRNVIYWYKLIDVDISGKETSHGPVKGEILFINDHLSHIASGEIPQQFLLHNNFPNPFNTSTSIQIDIPDNALTDESIALSIYTILGEKVQDLYRGPLSPGSYRLQWNGKNEAGSDMASGLYILVFQSRSYFSSKKMMLLR